MIICFSGTGNTLRVAHELQRHLGGEVVSLEGDLLLRPRKHELQIAEDEGIVWMFPVHSWGMPKAAERFIRGIKIRGCNERTRHYMVTTCGDDTGRADDCWAQAIGRRGWSPRAAFSVTMPNTYVCLKGYDTDAGDIAQAKLAEMPQRVADIAEKILKGTGRSDLERGSYAWLKTHVVFPLFNSFCMSDAPFLATEACTSCGFCAKECPVENIEMREGNPHWLGHCTMCLRCYHRCPVAAINYGKETLHKGRIPQGGYDAPIHGDRKSNSKEL